jgi:glycosyltransferase involved in cell wall biosynthesis
VGTVVEPGRPEALAEGIRRTLDPERLDTFRQAAREAKDRFTWAASAGATADVYRAVGQPPRPIRVLHLITGLTTGGAEMVLFRLLSGLPRERFAPLVVSMTEAGPVGRMLEEIGVSVTSLGMPLGRPDPRALVRLARIQRSFQPDILQTWLHQADLLGSVAARLLRWRCPVIWGLHSTTIADRTRAARASVAINARLSRRVPQTIVCCADAAAERYAELGYAAERMRVIRNGFDLPEAPADARASVRMELGVADEARLVGRFGRYHAHKDFPNLARAVERVLRQDDDVHVLLAGAGLDADNAELIELLPREFLRRIHLLGERRDVTRLAAALDVMVSSSSSEALPLVIGEAMALGVPCVVTDVGECRELVGDAGIVVPPHDAAALADAIRHTLALDATERALIGEQARARIRQHYSLDHMVSQYADLYECAAGGRTGGAPR